MVPAGDLKAYDSSSQCHDFCCPSLGDRDKLSLTNWLPVVVPFYFLSFCQREFTHRSAAWCSFSDIEVFKVTIFSRHLFAVGSASYGKMMKDTENQVIVIR